MLEEDAEGGIEVFDVLEPSAGDAPEVAAGEAGELGAGDGALEVLGVCLGIEAGGTEESGGVVDGVVGDVAGAGDVVLRDLEEGWRGAAGGLVLGGDEVEEGGEAGDLGWEVGGPLGEVGEVCLWGEAGLKLGLEVVEPLAGGGGKLEDDGLLVAEGGCEEGTEGGVVVGDGLWREGGWIGRAVAEDAGGRGDEEAAGKAGGGYCWAGEGGLEGRGWEDEAEGDGGLDGGGVVQVAVADGGGVEAGDELIERCAATAVQEGLKGGWAAGDDADGARGPLPEEEVTQDVGGGVFGDELDLGGALEIADRGEEVVEDVLGGVAGIECDGGVEDGGLGGGAAEVEVEAAEGGGGDGGEGEEGREVRGGLGGGGEGRDEVGEDGRQVVDGEGRWWRRAERDGRIPIVKDGVAGGLQHGALPSWTLSVGWVY
ncbi:MAG: hypothetical protein U0821_26995 [Chloroflexota bacterium]